MLTKNQIDQLENGSAVSGIGARLAPLFTWRGQHVYPVFGAEGEDDDGGAQDSESDDDDKDDTGKGDTEESSEKGVTRKEFDQLRDQLRAADKNRAAAEKKLKDIEDGKKDELTKATERVVELEKARETDAKEIAEMRLQNAFLTADTGITWHDPADALALAERRGYLDGVVGEDGKVDAKVLSTKLKEMAKNKPNLVKTGSDSEDDKGTPAAKTGGNVGSKGGKGKDTGPDLSRYDKLLNR